MFDDLADPNPPEPDAGARALVGRRAQQLHRRSVAARSALASLLVLVIVGGVVATGRRGVDTQQVLTNPEPPCCGTVDGTVRASDGAVGGATVQVIKPVSTTEPGSSTPGAVVPPNPWRIVATAQTDGMGRYRIDNLEGGDYVVRVVDHATLGRNGAEPARHTPSFFDNAAVASKATVVHVGAQQTTTVDPHVEVAPNFTIHGKLTLANPEGAGAGGGTSGSLPVKDITVRLYIGGELTRETTSNSVGDFDLGGVAPGEYTLAYVDNSARDPFPGYQSKWFLGGDHPQTFTVTADQSVDASTTLVRDTAR